MMTVPFESKRSLNSNSLTRERWSFGTIVHHFLCWLSKYSRNSLHQHLIFQFIDLSCGEQYKFALSSSFMLETNLGLVHFRDRVSSVNQSCPTLWDPMDCSMPGFPVYHQLPELTQTHAHRVSDTIQPSHPLLSPSPPGFNLSQHESFPMSQFFTSGGQTIGVSG